MKDARKNKKTKKQPIVGKPRTAEGNRLRKLLNELHEDGIKEKYKNSNSRQRAEDILKLIRSRQEEQDKKEAMQHWIRFVEHIEKVASKKAIDFLNKMIAN